VKNVLFTLLKLSNPNNITSLEVIGGIVLLEVLEALGVGAIISVVIISVISLSEFLSDEGYRTS
jgi:hypothetical protein